MRDLHVIEGGTMANAAAVSVPCDGSQIAHGYAAGKVVMFANTDWYLYNFRLPLAVFLRARGMSVVMLCPDGPYCERLRAAGFRVIVVNMGRRSVRPWKEMGVVRELADIYRREQPDVVHHFTIKCVIYGSMAARLASIKATINAVAGLGYVFANGSLYARLLRPLVRNLFRFTLRGQQLRLILQNGSDVERFRREAMISSSSIRLIRGSGVDTQRFTPAQHCVDRPVTTVLLAARLLWDKGVGEFVAAARICRQLGKPIRFLLAGTHDLGNPDSVQRQDIEAWRKEGVVELLGHVVDMPGLLQQVDIAALPTIYGEGVPRFLLEAAASGLPLIATETPGCTDIVHDGVTGLLIRPGDARDLAAAIMRLHENSELRRTMGAAARRLAEREFDENLVLRRTWEVYEELCGTPPPSSSAANQPVLRPQRLRAV